MIFHPVETCGFIGVETVETTCVCNGKCAVQEIPRSYFFCPAPCPSQPSPAVGDIGWGACLGVLTREGEPPNNVIRRAVVVGSDHLPGPLASTAAQFKYQTAMGGLNRSLFTK